MDKYDGMYKPEVNLSRNNAVARTSLGEASLADCECETAQKDTQELVKSAESPRESVLEESVRPRKGSRILNFLLRGGVAAALLGFLFLPKIIPYDSSEKVTEVAKTIIMSDIIPANGSGEGKLVEIVRKLFTSESSDEADEEEKE